MRQIHRAKSLLLVASCASCLSLRAQEPETLDLDVAMQAAEYKATVDGDLEGAIADYEHIVARSGADRAIAAQALLRTAEAYETLGLEQARSIYTTLAEDYADQTEPARVARLRLGSLAGGAPALNAVLIDMGASRDDWLSSHEVSPDGQQIVFVASWDADAEPERRGPIARNGTANVSLYVSDLSGAVVRPLLSDWGTVDHLVGSDPWNAMGSVAYLRWSPDGSRVAFKAARPASDVPLDLATRPSGGSLRQAYAPAIFVTDLDSGSPEQVGPKLESRIFDLWWNPDGTRLGYLTEDGIYERAMDGETTHTIEMPANNNIRIGGFSPDGRWLAFTDRVNQQVTLFVIPATGGRAIPVSDVFTTEFPNFGVEGDYRPAWSRTGRSLYVTSNSGGSRNIWRFGFDPETGRGTGEKEQITAYVDGAAVAPQIIKATGGLAFKLLQRRTAINVATADRPQDFHVIARGTNPLLTPDGQTLIYLGDGPERQGIFAVDSNGGTPRRLSSQNVELDVFGGGFLLSPDGEMLIYQARDDDRRHIYALSLQTEEQTKLYSFAPGEKQGTVRLSPDGTTLAFIEGDKRLFRLPLEGGEPALVAELWDWDEWSVRWSPDSSQLAALGWESPNVDENSVFVVDAAGGEPRRLTPILNTPGAYIEGLEWHPDGQRLSYFDYDVERTRFVDLDGKISEPIFDHPEGWEYLGNWSPDGLRYFFGSSVESYWNTYVYDTRTGAIGPGLRTGNDPSVSESTPTWSRDGNTVAWTTSRQTEQIWILENID